jgi:DNA-binding transcriptional ArsR family regulator
MPPTSAELISAVRHPLRRRILLALAEGSVESASTMDLARAMDQRVARVAYHLKTLAKGAILRPVPNGWTLDVDPEWLRLVLEVWAEADVSG